jgi:hypothetical protein
MVAIRSRVFRQVPTWVDSNADLRLRKTRHGPVVPSALCGPSRETSQMNRSPRRRALMNVCPGPSDQHRRHFSVFT